MNEHTPESSPLPTPKYRKEEIELLIPPNIRDPLNLSMPDDDLAERALISPNATRKKRSRNRKRRRTNSASEVLDAGQHHSELKPTLDLKIVKQTALSNAQTLLTVETKVEIASNSREFKEMKFKPEPIRHGRRSEDKIVSPVVPQPGARKRNSSFPRTISKDLSTVKNPRQFTRGTSKDPSLPDSAASKDQSNHQSTLVKNTPRFQYGNYDRYLF